MAFNLEEEYNQEAPPAEQQPVEAQAQPLQLTSEDVNAIKGLKAQNDFSGIGKLVAELIA